MERTRWTDERLDKEMARIDRTSDRLFDELRAMRLELKSEIQGLRADVAGEVGSLRSEMRSEIGGLRSDMRSEIGGLRTEMRSEIGGLRGDLNAFKRQVIYILAGFVVALIGLLGASIS